MKLVLVPPPTSASQTNAAWNGRPLSTGAVGRRVRGDEWSMGPPPATGINFQEEEYPS